MSGDDAAKKRASAAGGSGFKPRQGQWVEFTDAEGNTRRGKYRGVGKDGTVTVADWGHGGGGKTVNVAANKVKPESGESQRQRRSLDAAINRRAIVDTSVMANPNLKIVGATPMNRQPAPATARAQKKQRLKDFQASLKTMTPAEKQAALKKWYDAGGKDRPLDKK